MLLNAVDYRPKPLFLGDPLIAAECAFAFPVLWRHSFELVCSCRVFECSVQVNGGSNIVQELPRFCVDLFDSQVSRTSLRSLVAERELVQILLNQTGESIAVHVLLENSPCKSQKLELGNSTIHKVN